jgi:hypothetical protein
MTPFFILKNKLVYYNNNKVILYLIYIYFTKEKEKKLTFGRTPPLGV